MKSATRPSLKRWPGQYCATEPDPSTALPLPLESPTLNSMKTFRLLLTLLLCLAVPTAGWASLMSGPLCPRLHHHQETSEHVMQHAHADHGASPMADADHGADHCGDISTHGKPCKGDHCDCGCGTGACSSPLLSLVALAPTGFRSPASQERLPTGRATLVSASFGTPLLRPPIS